MRWLRRDALICESPVLVHESAFRVETPRPPLRRRGGALRPRTRSNGRDTRNPLLRVMEEEHR